jgi:tetratricopeptide (TPR) repeat protein
MKHIIILFLGSAVFSPAFSQAERKHIRQGNGHYEEGEYKKAEESYIQAMEKKPGSFEGAFNMGNATYRQGRYEDASNQFELTAKKEADKEATARSYHNLGNSLLQGKQYEKSIEAYKNALRNDPSDNDTKYNLAYAQQMLAKQQQQEQEQNQDNKDQEEQKDKDKDKQEQENKDKQDQKDQQEKDQGQKDQQNKGEEEKKDQKQEGKQQPRPDQISKEDAQRLLEALKNDEQKLQEKLKKKKLKATKIKIEKDW